MTLIRFYSFCRSERIHKLREHACIGACRAATSARRQDGIASWRELDQECRGSLSRVVLLNAMGCSAGAPIKDKAGSCQVLQ